MTDTEMLAEAIKEKNKILRSMNKSVKKAFAQKKASGHYAVVWDDKQKKVVKIPASEL